MANPDLVLSFKFQCSGRDIGFLNLVPWWRCSVNIQVQPQIKVQVRPRSGTKVYLLRKLCFLGLKHVIILVYSSSRSSPE